MASPRSLDLPAAAPTRFVGRRHELSEARRLLGANRVLTLVGAGGAGKTRLALRLAADVRRSYRDGVHAVMLAELRDPALLAHAVVEELGIYDQSARPPLDTLRAHLAEQECLLVLDNCEHLVDAVAHLVGALLASCPNLHVLATSRQSLGIAGETSMPVPPLGPGEAVDLFTDRVTALMPGFRATEDDTGAILRICQRLDGLPLAIELAAARVRVLSPAQLEQRLDARYEVLTRGARGAPPRQQTLRALVDWSHDLCTPQERLLWARASVFSGGFDLEAAELVCAGDGIGAADVLDLVDSLVDKSILIPAAREGTMRYRMLETLREYGAERLDEAGETVEVGRRHRDWILGLARMVREVWEGPDQPALLARMRREHANIRVALDFCLSDPDEVAAGFLIATCLDDYWGIRGMHTEARLWLGQALHADERPTAQRAAALRLAGWFALFQGDAASGVPLIQEADALAEATGDDLTRANVLQDMGMVGMFSGDLAGAEAFFDRSLASFRALGDVRGELFAHFGYGTTVAFTGDTARAKTIIDAGLEKSAQRGEIFWRGWLLYAATLAEYVAADQAAAQARAREALGIHRLLDNRIGIAFCVNALAWTAEQDGDHRRAARLLGASDATWTGVGSAIASYQPAHVLHVQSEARVREALGEEVFEAEFTAGHDLALPDAIELALSTGGPGAATRAARAADAATVVPPRGVATTGGTGGTLTRRESEVAALVAEGLTNKEIAARLVVSVRTAEGHVEKALVKLGLRSRAQLAAWYTAHARSRRD